MFCDDYQGLKKNLERRGFIVHDASCASEAKELGLALIGDGSVGFGGSMTVADLGLYDALKARGNAVYHHWQTPPAERKAVYPAARTANWYAASSNAVLGDGRLVNIDATGNRVSSMIMGPEKVLLFIGKNKLAGDLDSGIARIKENACPPNARRLKLDKLPCAVTGHCADCASEQRICRVTVIIEAVPKTIKEFHLILIDEEIGW